MSVRSLGLQTLIPRSAGVAGSQQAEKAAPEAAQQAFFAALQRKAERQQAQVQGSSGPEAGAVTPEGRGKGQGRPRQKGRRARDEAAPEPGKGTRLDVRL